MQSLVSLVSLEKNMASLWILCFHPWRQLGRNVVIAQQEPAAVEAKNPAPLVLDSVEHLSVVHPFFLLNYLEVTVQFA